MNALESLITSLETNDKQPWEPVKNYLPKGFLIDEKGVYIDGTDLEQISGPCWVSSQTRSQNADEWGIVVQWLDMDGNLKNAAFPQRRLHESRSTIIPDLSAMGLRVIPGKDRKLLAYLGSFDLPFRLQSVSQLGWTDCPTESPRFVMPNHVIEIGEGDQIIFQPEEHSPTTRTMKKKGSLDLWRAMVAEPCSGNPILVFCLCAGFAGSLLKFAGLDSGGFHIFGGSSKGKTTALQVAASLWGSGGDPAVSEDSYIGRWNTTGNALEATAAAHNDGLLLLDEMGTCDVRDFGKVIYDLFGGRGKSRLTKNAMLQNSRSWRLFGLSTGEISVSQQIEEAGSGKKAKTGQLTRLADVPITGGVVIDTHGKAPADFVNQLKKSCGEYFGTAGPAFIERLIRQTGSSIELRAYIQGEVEKHSKALYGNLTLETFQQRVIQRFAVVLTAGILAVDFGILPFTEKEVTDTVKVIRSAWLNDDENKPEGYRALKQLQEFLHKHESRFRPSNEPDKDVRDLTGYRDHSNGLYLLLESTFREACPGIHQKAIVDELNTRGYLFKNEGDRLKSKHSLGGKIGRTRLYAIHEHFLTDFGV